MSSSLAVFMNGDQNLGIKSNVTHFYGKWALVDNSISKTFVN